MQTKEPIEVLVPKLLWQKEVQYGDFAENLSRMADYASCFSFKCRKGEKEKICKEYPKILATLLTLKMARLFHIWTKSEREKLEDLKGEDSYIDLIGYSTLIRRNFPKHIGYFEELLTDSEKDIALKKFANRYLH